MDKVRGLLYGEGRYRDKEMRTATIFRGDLRVSTNVRDENGNRAIGTRVSEEVYQAVVQKGQPWLDRAFVVHDGYITGYEPIRDLNGRIEVQSEAGRGTTFTIHLPLEAAEEVPVG